MDNSLTQTELAETLNIPATTYSDYEQEGKCGDGVTGPFLRYIGSSTKANATDTTTKRLNEIVTFTKSKKDIGVRYMKSW